MNEPGKGFVKCFYCGKAGDFQVIKFVQFLHHKMEDGTPIRIKVMVDKQDQEGKYAGNMRFCPDCVERVVIEGVSA